MLYLCFLYFLVFFAPEISLADEQVVTVLQRGHDVNCLSVSPDGLLLATGSEDGTIKIWLTADGRLVRDISAGGHVASISFAPKNNVMAASSGRSLKFWDVNTGKLLNNIDNSIGYFSSFSHLGFSPDGNYVVGTCKDIYTAMVWNLKAGDVVKKYDDTGELVCLSPDEKYMATGGKRNGLRLWHFLTDRIQWQRMDKRWMYYSVRFSPDGKYLVAGVGIKANDDEMEKFTGMEKISHYKLIFLEVATGKITNEIDVPGIVHSIVFSQNKKHLAISVGPLGNIFLISFPKWEIINNVNISGRYLWFVGEQHLVACHHGPRIDIVDLSQNKIFRSIESHLLGWPLDEKQKTRIGNIEQVISPCGKYIATYKHGEILVININNSNTTKIKSEEIALSYGVRALVFSHDSKYLAAINKRGAQIWEMPLGTIYKTNEAFKGLQVSDDNFWLARMITFSPDGNYLGIVKDRTVEFWEISTGKLWQKIVLSQEKTGHIIHLSFSPQEDLMVADMDVLGTEGSHILFLVNWKTGNVLKEIKKDARSGSYIHHAVFSANGKILAWEDDRIISLREAQTLQRIKNLDTNFPYFFKTIVFSPDSKYLAAAHQRQIYLWEVGTGKKIEPISHPEGDYFRALAFSTDGKRLIGVGIQYCNTIWDIADMNKLRIVGKNYIFPEATLTVTPEGLFCGAGDFNKFIHFSRGLKIYDFNQFYDVFYRPDLVEKKLRGEDLSKEMRGLNLTEALDKPPPKVEIQAPQEGQEFRSREVTVKVKVQDAGGQVGDIRLLHNGKLVESLGVYRLAREEGPAGVALARAEGGGRGGVALRRVTVDPKALQSTPFEPQKGVITKEYRVTLVNGDNTLTACAFNGPNTVMSEMVSVRVRCLAPARPPELYVLAVGLNTFDHPGLPDLTYAVKDARDLAGLLAQAGKPLYHKVHVQTLLEEEASKANILKAARDLGQRMWPEDVLVVAMATHGRADGYRYFLYTHAPGGGDSPERMLTSPELMEISKAFRALKQVWFLDTCQAGGIKGAMTPLYDGRVSVLAKALGMHVLAGAGSEQVARDDYQGNGLFTHFLLKGLKGAADANQDGRIQVQELGAYLNKMVGEASRGDQVPFIRTFGEDLPLALVSK
ncbi:MAG: hypothetical protein FJ128_05135 [Deltaproteobacteria bacterium]|nr:hypothetical protein [Deltaproteobacteria bacterium]MBM4284617.1 hypothetical protein [Deltaproteobacteria bacterium]